MKGERTPNLTEREKESPFAKYYAWKHGALDEATFAAYQEDAVIDPSQATSIYCINDLLKPGHLPMERGVCLFPDGCAVFANHILMPEVTPDMFAWFMCWFPLEDLRYKIWVPGAHYGVSITDETRKLLMDPDRTYANKIKGTKRIIYEDMGGGLGTLNMTWLLPVELGFDMGIYPKEPDEGFFIMVLASNAETKMNLIICQYVRPLLTGGSELRSRFWIGYGMENGRIIPKLPNGAQVPRHVVRFMWEHNILEYSRLRDLIPLLYKEFGDKPLDFGMIGK